MCSTELAVLASIHLFAIESLAKFVEGGSWNVREKETSQFADVNYVVRNIIRICNALSMLISFRLFQ